MFAALSKIERVERDPWASHWTGSPLEEVTDAQALFIDNSIALTKIDFLAPKLIGNATWRTEHIGARIGRDNTAYYLWANA